MSPLSSPFLRLPLHLLLLLSPAHALTCSNYGYPNTTAQAACVCPSPFLPPSCLSPSCSGNFLLPTSLRQPLPALANVTDANFGSHTGGGGGNASYVGAGCGCDAGWTGEGCGVCTTDAACDAAFARVTAATGNQDALTGASTTADAVCNAQPWTRSAGMISCDVQNPTLQALFPLNSVLTIQKFVNPSKSLFPPSSASSSFSPPSSNATAFGTAATMLAQLWYAGVEQFYCHADQCVQSNKTAAGGGGQGQPVDWVCQDLQCQCVPGSAFCGGVPLKSIEGTISQLSGTVTITCTTASCTFNQALLASFFGSGGLSLTGCSFGECVSRAVLNEVDSSSAGGTGGGGSGSSLSAGVIAALAVIGAAALVLLALIAWAIVAQRKARRRSLPHGLALGVVEEKSAPGRPSEAGRGVAWHAVSYDVPSPRPSISTWSRSLAAAALPIPRRRRQHLVGGGDGERPEEAAAAATTEPGKTVLLNSEGSVAPGHMLAILGPSGAGKSTLVDILAGKAKRGHVRGRVSFSGGGGGGSVTGTGRPRVGFVSQSDVLPPTLTPREYLLFSAHLRLPHAESLPQSSIRTHVFEVLRQLGLTDVADVRMGNEERRGLSGGEKRRVSIALEVLTRPEVLILDEPTSGLDSVSAANVISVLQNLASDPVYPTTVVCSIHQPSSKIYRAFTHVLLLSLGRQLYFGPGRDAPAEHFARRGVPCPVGYNVADHLLEIASDPSRSVLVDARSGGGSKQDRKEIVGAVDDGASASASGGMKANGDAKDTSASAEMESVLPVLSPGEPFSRRTRGQVNDAHATTTTTVEAESPTPKEKTTCRTTFLTQFEVISGREWLNLKRDKSLFLLHLGVALILGVFCGGLYFHVNLTIAGFQSRVGSLFFIGALIAFTSLSSLSNLVERKELFVRERAAGYYRPGAWLLSTILFDVIPLRLIPTIACGTIIYWMVGLAPHPAQFFKYLFVLALFNIASVLFNLVLAASIRNGGAAILLGSIVTLFEMAYAGFFVNLGRIPPVLRWLQYLSLLKYALEALSVNEVMSGLQIEDVIAGVPVNISAVTIMNLLFGFGEKNYWRDVVIFVAFIAGFSVILVSVVGWKLRERR